MTALLAWLDTSAEEQRRVRELVALYTQPESRDELGIGQVRDAFSDTLFPGTSVLQTRARYYLLVPWAYKSGERRLRGQALKAHADRQERELIRLLRPNIGAGQGLIGRVAGAALKTLPSAIYWSGLVRYGIALDLPTDQLGASADAGDDADELTERRVQQWSPTLPPMPERFPQSITSLELEPDEAWWLRERILEATPGTMLAHLLEHHAAPDPASGLPWEDPACLSAPEEPADVLHHASLFSEAVHGAALLYNLLIAERYERAGLDRVTQPVHSYRARLAAWAQRVEDYRPQLQTWNRAELWAHVLRANPRVNGRTRQFVDRWLQAVVDGTGLKQPEARELRDLVAARERLQKGRQSRLQNDKLLRTWSGESGTARLGYRWGNVRQVVLDIRGGVDRAGA